MKDVILYGSQYGSTYRYAQKLSEQTGIPAVSYKDAPALSDKKIIVYLGGLYAGGILGLMKTLRGFFSSGWAKAAYRYRRAGRPQRTGKPEQHPRFSAKATPRQIA